MGSEDTTKAVNGQLTIDNENRSINSCLLLIAYCLFA